MTLTVTTLHH